MYYLNYNFLTFPKRDSQYSSNHNDADYEHDCCYNCHLLPQG